jgi:hypothetical protein
MSRPLVGYLAIAVALMLVAISISHVMSPEEHRLSAGPAVMWPAIAEDARWSRLLSVEWLVAGVLALAVVPAATDGAYAPATACGMVVAHHVELGRLRVGLDLLDALAAGDHAGDGRVLQAPGQRPGRHVDALRHLLAADPLGLLERALHDRRSCRERTSLASSKVASGRYLPLR